MSADSERLRRCSRALETVLEFLEKKKDASDTLRSLRTGIPCPASILEAGPGVLESLGLGADCAQLLSLTPELTRCVLGSQFGRSPVLSSLSAAQAYVRAMYVGVSRERFCLLCLDDSGRLIRSRMLQEGTVNETPFYLSQVLQHVTDCGARAVVLCHNHPGGTTHASDNDVRCTMLAIRALHAIGIMLLDHLIVADSQVVSMRSDCPLPNAMWVRQNTSSRLLKNWLDAPD